MLHACPLYVDGCSGLEFAVARNRFTPLKWVSRGKQQLAFLLSSSAVWTTCALNLTPQTHTAPLSVTDMVSNYLSPGRRARLVCLVRSLFECRYCVLPVKTAGSQSRRSLILTRSFWSRNVALIEQWFIRTMGREEARGITCSLKTWSPSLSGSFCFIITI